MVPLCLHAPVRGTRNRPAGFSLTEFIIVAGALAVLLTMLLPSLNKAKDLARRTVCAQQMSQIGVALKQWALQTNNRMPAFAFSDPQGDFPLSGHWGGQSQLSDPDCFGRQNVANVNLWQLVAGGLLPHTILTCPAGDEALRDGTASYFPYSSKFSTYCLRMPYSPDLFEQAPELADYGRRGLLGIYTMAGGGYRFHVGTAKVMVPLVRADRDYRETDSAGLSRPCNLSAGAVLADQFWRQDRRTPADTSPTVRTYGVRAAWYHDTRFNVLFGDGAVQAVRDDGTVRANSCPPDYEFPSDGANGSSHSVRVWRYFEDNR